MSKELLSQQAQSQIEVLKNTRPEDFSKAYNSCVEFSISEKIVKDIANSVGNGEVVGIVISHQSFGDVEVVRHFCEKINEVSSPQIVKAYEAYSMPAVGSIQGFFDYRKEEYQKTHLNMLGLIRSIDYSHPKYQKNITPEMETIAKENLIELFKAFKSKEGSLFFIPFESTLKSGRTNPETGQIYGMQEVSPQDSLLGNLFQKRKKRKIKILPCGIDGGYNILHPETHLFDPNFINLLKNKKSLSTKIVTTKATKLIDISSPTYLKKNEEEIFIEIVTNIAQNLSLEARGDYKELVTQQENNQSSRVNLL